MPEPCESQPLVSVLLPVFNAEAHVENTIRSVLAQTYRNLQLIVVDDGSTDNSAAIIDRLCDEDDRIHIQKQPNAGMAKTLNRMIRECSTELIARIDADDMAEPNRIESQVRFMQAHQDCNVLGSAVTNVDEDGDPLNVEQYPELHDAIEQRMLSGSGGIIHPSTMLRRRAVLAAGCFAEDCPVVEDQDLWLRMALRGRLHNLQEPLTRYRVHAGNMTFTRQEFAREQLLKVLAQARRDRGINEEVQLELAEIIESDWDRRRVWAWSAVEAGFSATAKKHARRILFEKPTSRKSWTLVAHAFFPKLCQRLRANKIAARQSDSLP